MMMGQQTQFRMARARYRTVDVTSKVDGASPHQLVVILFDELLTSLDAAMAALAKGDVARRAERQARALAILHALEASLDFEKGGEIAQGLATIYREARRLTARASQENDPKWMKEARQMVGEIATAWKQIG